MRATYWWLLLGLVLGTSLARAADGGDDQFYLGVSRDVVLKTLGKPTFSYPPDQDGKELWYYKKASVTLIKGIVVSWSNFNEKTPQRSDGAPAVRMGSSLEDVAAALGFPPNAKRYTGLVIGKKPIGDEEWTYRGGTLVFQDGVVVGWRNVTTPIISLGTAQADAKTPTIGSPARDVVSCLGTPPMLTCYAATGEQVWVYPQVQTQFALLDGKVSWYGPLQAPPVVSQQPATGGPAATGANTNTTGSGNAGTGKDEQGFTSDPQFNTFRTAYQRVVDKMVEKTPKFSETEEYKAIMDCLNLRPWWSISAQADISDEYAAGLDMIEQAFNEYKKANKK